MKKLFTLLMLLVAIVTGAWATDYHYVDLTTYDLTANFRSALTQDGTSREIDGTTFTKTRKFGSTVSSLGNPNDIGTKYIVYEVKSTVTNLDIYAYNSNTSDATLTVAEVEEGATEATTTVLTFKKSAGSKLPYEVKSSKNCTLYFFTNNTKLLIGDIVAKETGTALPTGGEAGFSMSFNKGRSAIKSGTATTIENMEFVIASNYSALSSTEVTIKNKGTHYVKFTTTENTKVTVSVSTSQTYYISSTVNASETPAPTAYTATAEDVELAAGTWYIVPDGSNVKVTGLSFAASTPATKHTVTYSLGDGTSATGAPTQADVAEGAMFTVANAPTDLVPPTGKEFKCWNDGANDYNAGAEYTMGESDVEFTAVYQNETVKYAVEYALNGGTGTAPTQASVAEGTVFTVASAEGITAPEGKVFKCWNDGTNDYNAGADYTMGNAPVTLTAQWLTNNDATFSNGQYAIGGSALDLSTLFSSSSDGAVTYTVKSAGDTGAAIAGTSFTATEAGTATVTATQAATATYAGASVDAIISVGGTVGAQTIKWTLSPLNSSSASLTSSQTSSSIYLNNLTTINHTLVGLASSASKASNRTAKVNRLAGKDSDKYIYVTFDVEDGYSFVPSSVAIKVANVSDVTTFDAELIGENGESVSETGKSFSSIDGTVETWTITPSAQKSLTGTVTLKIYAYAETAGAFRFGNTITIAGAVVADPVNVTIGAGGFSTFAGKYNYKVSGAKALTAQNQSTNVKFTEIASETVIPANTGVVLQGTEGDEVTITYTNDAADAVTTDMVGVTEANPFSNNNNVYVIATKNSVTKFYKYTGSTFPAGKAYLNAAANTSALDIVFDGEATAINGVAENVADAAPVKVIKGGKLYIGNYNVAGQQVK